MTQANESLGLTASQHIEKILDHARARGLPSACGLHKDAQIFDYALVHTAPISESMRARYAAEGQQPIEADLDRIRALGVTPITGDFQHEGSVLRHDYDHVADTLLKLALEHPR
jgi:hypothetical protein